MHTAPHSKLGIFEIRIPFVHVRVTIRNGCRAVVTHAVLGAMATIMQCWRHEEVAYAAARLNSFCTSSNQFVRRADRLRLIMPAVPLVTMFA
jgi:hypothetical protein